MMTPISVEQAAEIRDARLGLILRNLALLYGMKHRIGGPMALKLRYSPASPFVRKVLVFAHEAGLADGIELIATDVWAADSDIKRDNPLGKVPALVTDAGTFIGSTLCCEYLHTLHRGRPLIPTAPAERWPVLRLHALGGGIMEAAGARVVEAVRRPKELVFQGNLDRQEAK